ncbi:hypothetical protein HA402_008684 [Bradysia odoriphaga]|nr:hypothetical protein HA402_008684 [Bradysia odoriphaga]
MSKSKPTIHQFKIELLDTQPTVWRQVYVPSTFDMSDLHGALVDAMGWEDYHFHVFKVLNLKTKRTDFVGRPIEHLKKGPVDGQTVPLTNYFTKPGHTAEYWYDFGDRWEHRVLLQKVLPAEDGINYPVCINGRMACPPEDCGGTDGYNKIVQVLKNKAHPEYASTVDWLKTSHNRADFDVDVFRPGNVRFRPKEQRKYTFNNPSEANFYDCIQM